MKYTALVVLSVWVGALAGCVSTAAHKKIQDELAAARQASAQMEAEFASFKQQTQQTQQDLESTVARLRSEQEDMQKVNAQLQDERSQFMLERNDLQRQLQELDDHAKDLTTRIAAEQSQVAKLREDKQRLLAGTTTAQGEIERMQNRIGALEIEEARAKDLEHRLAERGKELLDMHNRMTELEANLQRQLAERESQVASLTDARDRLTREREELAQERDQLSRDQEELAAERDRLRLERDQLMASMAEQQDRLTAEAEARLAREREAKEAEIRRLTQTHDNLKKSLEAEIAKGDIRIRQVRDRLTINMVDRVLFDSGYARVKPTGLKVLKQMSDVLKSVDDKQIRIEGHTDNVPIGVKLQDRFPTNWELSTARATSVVRYLIEKGEIDPANISAVGYADTRPIASNAEEDGRRVNRRIEIVLYPRDLKGIARDVGSEGSNHSSQSLF